MHVLTILTRYNSLKIQDCPRKWIMRSYSGDKLVMGLKPTRMIFDSERGWILKKKDVLYLGVTPFPITGAGRIE